jgi:phosphate/sulfate permease
MNENGLKLPDITPAQIVAVVGSVIAVAVAAGLDISDELQESIITLVTVIAPIILGADAVIRHGRSRALGVPPRPPLENGDDTGV